MDSKGFLSEGEISKLVRVKIESFLHNNPNCKKAELAKDISVNNPRYSFANFSNECRKNLVYIKKFICLNGVKQ